MAVEVGVSLILCSRREDCCRSEGIFLIRFSEAEREERGDERKKERKKGAFNLCFCVVDFHLLIFQQFSRERERELFIVYCLIKKQSLLL